MPRQMQSIDRTKHAIVSPTSPVWIATRCYNCAVVTQANAALLSPTKAALLEAMMWYHGTIQRNLAESLLSGKDAGTFLVRFSQTKNEYCVSLMSTSGSVQHFVTLTSPDG